MRAPLAVLMFAGIGMLIATPASAGTIDFDTLPGGGVLSPGDVLTTQYASEGVIFSAFEDGLGVSSVLVLGTDWGIADALPANDGLLWANSSTTNLGNRHDILRIDFASPVSDVQFYTNPLGGTSTQPTVFRAYSSEGVLLETVNSPSDGSWTFHLTQFTASGISYIEGSQPFDNWAFGIDNLSFESAVVPEPATLSLFGLGLVGVAARVRRRMKGRWAAPHRLKNGN